AGRPPPKPSARSANPSRSRPPVSRAPAPTPSRAAKGAERPSHTPPAATTPVTDPSRAPSTGAHDIAHPAVDRSPLSTRTGNTVKAPKAIRAPATASVPGRDHVLAD